MPQCSCPRATHSTRDHLKNIQFSADEENQELYQQAHLYNKDNFIHIATFKDVLPTDYRMAMDGIDQDSVETASLEDNWVTELPDLRADPDNIEAWELPTKGRTV